MEPNTGPRLPELNFNGDAARLSPNIGAWVLHFRQDCNIDARSRAFCVKLILRFYRVNIGDISEAIRGVPNFKPVPEIAHLPPEFYE